MTRLPVRYDQIVFSGGGTRCFWHGGFMSVVGSFQDMRPERMSAVSGGALSGATWISGRDEKLREVMGQAFDRNVSNVDPSSDNFTPHQEIYRDVVSETLDSEAIEAIADGPLFQVLLGRPPKGLPARAGSALAIALYEADQTTRSTPHLRLPKATGVRGTHVDARQAARDGKLVDLICAAATIPPVFDIPQWEGEPVIDGGTVDKAPLPEPDEGSTLLLLTRLYRNLPEVAGRTYIQPSEPVDADKIDFTDRSKIEETWKQGEEDAKAWLASVG